VAAFRSGGRERVLAVFRDPHATDDADGSAMVFAQSDDGGAHWTSAPVPVSGPELQGPGPMIAEPTLAVSPVLNDRGGTEVYFAAVASVPSLPSALHRQIVISRSVDGGRTFLPANVAAAPRVTDRCQTADHPSLAVDAAGHVHLVFVADAGLPTEGLRHWIGYPNSTACSYSCMWWQPQPEAIDPDMERRAISGVIVRTMRNALYIVYEQIAPLDGATDIGLARIVSLRFDPFMRSWVHTTEQPSRGHWFRAPLLAEGPTGRVAAGKHVDFGFVGETAWITWSEIGTDASSMLLAQSFQFIDVLEERWNDSEIVFTSPAGTRVMQPTLAIRGDSVPTISWFEQREGDAGATLDGSARTGSGESPWTAPRDLASIGGSNRVTDACTDGTPWVDQLAAIGLGGTTPMTLTIHATRTCAGGAIGADTLTATRWAENGVSSASN
jgi:hypothetical protein